MIELTGITTNGNCCFSECDAVYLLEFIDVLEKLAAYSLTLDLNMEPAVFSEVFSHLYHSI